MCQSLRLVLLGAGLGGRAALLDRGGLGRVGVGLLDGVALAGAELLRPRAGRRCGPLVLTRQREADQRRVAGARSLVDAAVREAGEHPLGLLPRAQPRAPGGGDLLALAQVVDE